jgi:thiosulfate dehydrogenase [quinone] large subunit
MNATKNLASNKNQVKTLDDPPVAQALFGDVRWAWLWLLLRLFLGWQWSPVL